MARRSSSHKQSLWLERVRRWRQSQLGVRAFCVRDGLSEPNFYAWRRLLRQRGLLDEHVATHDAERATPTFVKVAVDPLVARGVAFEVVLAEGRVVRVHPGFDAVTLRQLLHVLEEPSC